MRLLLNWIIINCLLLAFIHFSLREFVHAIELPNKLRQVEKYDTNNSNNGNTYNNNKNEIFVNNNNKYYNKQRKNIFNGGISKNPNAQSKENLYNINKNIAITNYTHNILDYTSNDKYNNDVLAHYIYKNNNNNNNNNKNENNRNSISLRAPPKQQPVHTDDGDIHTTHIGQGRSRRALAEWLIAPNTRWCGRGNIANNTYNHLGGALAADKCCRKHDYCRIFIPPHHTRYEIFNYRLYTLSHCSCDRRFRTCLKMANDEDAKMIGTFYFNFMHMQCFVLHKEHVCEQRSINGTCVKEHIKQRAHLKENKKF